jgi:SAM-dependent methyltransferase
MAQHTAGATSPSPSFTLPKYLDLARIWRRVRVDVGRKLSHLGERWNKPTLIYNPLIFAHFHWCAKQSAPGVMDIFARHFPAAQKYIDVGAGTGAYAAAATRAGRQVVACENSAHARKVAKRQKVDIRPFDLNLNPAADVGGPFDLAYCFEVAEHLPPDLGEKLVDFIAAQAPLVVFTAAQPPYRGGIGHINEQPRQYWIERFEKRGMTYDDATTKALSAELTEKMKVAWWLGENVSVFRR